MAAGIYSGSVTVTDPNASNSPQTVNVKLVIKEAGQDDPPFGSFDTPIHNSTVMSSIPVTGWALDDVGIEKLEIFRDPVAGEPQVPIYIGDAVFIEGARSDVEQMYPDYPFNYKAGWGYMMLTNFLPNQGNGQFTIYARATDIKGNVWEDSKIITCDNANAVKPFGAIDTPSQGGPATGPDFLNWGWVLTPMPNSVPIDGSTISVYVDGVNIRNPTYNLYREDIATLFPGYANSEGAVGLYTLDTTDYENGIHTIQWAAVDNAGNSDGIGSRFFSIANKGTMAAGKKIQTSMKVIPGRSLTSLDGINLSKEPIYVRRGYGKSQQPSTVNVDTNSVFTLEICEVERVVLELGKRASEGYLAVGDKLRPLPIGSTLDRTNGVFYWQPGPGFIGKYDFIFITRGKAGLVELKSIKIKIRPKLGLRD
jgi:hypothetical protein